MLLGIKSSHTTELHPPSDILIDALGGTNGTIVAHRNHVCSHMVMQSDDGTHAAFRKPWHDERECSSLTGFIEDGETC